MDDDGERRVFTASTREYGPPGFSVTWSALATLAVLPIQTAAELAREISVAVPYQKGDAFILDNRLVMHSRREFRGEGKRKIYAALLGPKRARTEAT